MGWIAKMLVGTAVIGLAVAVGFVVGAEWPVINKQPMQQEKAFEFSQLNRLEDQISQLTDQVEDLRQARQEPEGVVGEHIVKELRGRIRKLAEAVTALQSANEARRLDAAQSVSSSANNDGEYSIEEMRQRAREQRKHIEDTFANETRDGPWANSMTVEIEEAFQSPKLSGGRLASADCRSTMCRVEVLYDTDDSTELFEFQNNLLIDLADDFKTGYAREVEGPDGRRMVAHFVRKGEQLPQLGNTGSAGGPGNRTQ